MRALYTAAGALIAIYAVLLLGVFLLQSRLVFFPHVGRALDGTPGGAGLAYEDVQLGTPDGEMLHGWYVSVAAPRGVVLIFHGNAGNISQRIGYLAMLHRLGYDSFIVDYRGYGQSTGAPSELGLRTDAEAAWRYLTATRGVEPRRVVIFGESLGGAVAAWLAVRERPAALVLASTFTSLTELGAEVYRFLPVRWLSRFEFDTRKYLASVDAPVLIAHSRDDEIIPYAHGRALFEAAREPKAFVDMRGGHNEGVLYGNDAWVRQLGAFLDRHVQEPSVR